MSVYVVLDLDTETTDKLVSCVCASKEGAQKYIKRMQNKGLGRSLVIVYKRIRFSK
jgi:hypothetical protein